MLTRFTTAMVRESLLCTTLASLAWPQTVPRVTLGRPQAQLSHAMKYVTTVRELSNGKAIVVDRNAMAVFVVDFSRDAVSQLPVSEALVGAPFLPTVGLPLPGDTTVVLDMWNGGRRAVVVTGDEKVSPSLLSLAAGAHVSSSALTDKDGRLYRALPSRSGRLEAIERYDRGKRRHDTINVREMSPAQKRSRPSRSENIAFPNQESVGRSTRPEQSLSLPFLRTRSKCCRARVEVGCERARAWHTRRCRSITTSKTSGGRKQPGRGQFSGGVPLGWKPVWKSPA